MPQLPPSNADDSSFDDSDQMSLDPQDEQIDAAYREVLERMDEIEWELQSAISDASNSLMESIGDPDDSDNELESTQGVEQGHADRQESESDPLDQLAAELLTEDFDNSRGDAASRPMQPGRILEAVLFVGGPPLTSKKLCSLLRREFDQDYVDRKIEELNEQYKAQNRPYEITLGEGGYRMELSSEYDAVRDRVYGLGPREIKLSQEALEVLSMVAYRQPVSKQTLEDSGKENAGATLRQLLRRDLIALERGEKRGDVQYTTTNRFLELFGLGDLEELPVADDLEFK